MLVGSSEEVVDMCVSALYPVVECTDGLLEDSFCWLRKGKVSYFRVGLHHLQNVVDLVSQDLCFWLYFVGIVEG